MEKATVIPKGGKTGGAWLSHWRSTISTMKRLNVLSVERVGKCKARQKNLPCITVATLKRKPNRVKLSNAKEEENVEEEVVTLQLASLPNSISRILCCPRPRAAPNLVVTESGGQTSCPDRGRVP